MDVLGSNGWLLTLVLYLPVIVGQDIKINIFIQCNEKILSQVTLMKIKHKAYIFPNSTVRNASRLDEPWKHLLYECYSAVFESDSWTKGSLEKVSVKSLLFNTMLYMWIHTCIYQSTTLTICKKILLWNNHYLWWLHTWWF